MNLDQDDPYDAIPSDEERQREMHAREIDWVICNYCGKRQNFTWRELDANPAEVCPDCDNPFFSFG